MAEFRNIKEAREELTFLADELAKCEESLAKTTDEAQRASIAQDIKEIKQEMADAKAYIDDRESQPTRDHSVRNLWIAAGIVAALAAGGYALLQSDYLKVTEGKTSTSNEAPAVPAEEVVVDKAKVIQQINNFTAKHGTLKKGNAELVYANFANEEMKEQEYLDSIGVVSDLAINSFRAGDAGLLDIAIAAQKSPVAKKELKATKHYIEQYLKDPNKNTATLLIAAGKLAMSDGITADQRSLADTSVHEIEMHMFSQVWPYIAENEDNAYKYDEKKLEAKAEAAGIHFVSKIPLAIEGPVWVKFSTVKRELNEAYGDAVDARFGSTKCIKEDNARKRTK